MKLTLVTVPHVRNLEIGRAYLFLFPLALFGDSHLSASWVLGKIENRTGNKITILNLVTGNIATFQLDEGIFIYESILQAAAFCETDFKHALSLFRPTD